MRKSPSSSVQAAKQVLADRLREIREEAGHSAKSLGEVVGWHPTKVSKLEHTVTSPSAEDIRVWCEACNVPEQAEDLVASARSVESAYVEWRRMERTGMRRVQEAAVPLYERTELFRIYEPALMPGLLQTPEYARALMRVIIDFSRIPDDLDEAVAARIARQRVLREGNHRFVVVLEESVLRTAFGDREIMAGQLGHVLSVMSMPNVALGIIPASSFREAMWPVNGFWLFDSERLTTELPSAQVTVTQPRELEVYLRTFEMLRGMAVFGEQARVLVLRALEVFTAPSD
ncbi:helix-turn-helix transcriptional regulator [Actinomadura graeca]|uniref:Helix-turn-helix transcriptional regulator n=1 Tax=Actinomadura graeca TaxID=2750812 RepID=A0ABX8QT51_9ACTN|nr:helix-turn-helix transcriptional regulator [Actinomadura graeca]QXJ21364.1 helix-turn-helix transcriptional regulator [Actinomadura graeca]